MLSFNALKMKTKLMLIVAIPLLGLLYCTISSTLEKAATAREMEKLASLVDVSVKIGTLVHELQKERGMTASFLGSKGVNYSKELPLQRNETDKKQNDLKNALQVFDANQYGASLKNSVDEALRDVAEIDAKRSAVTALSIPMRDGAGYYTKTIAKLLDIPNRTATLSSNGQIARMASAYTALMLAKEYTGQERAILTMAFSADKITAEAYAKFLAGSNAQDIYIKVFDAYALDEQKSFYKSKMSGRVVEEVAAIKNTVIGKVNEDSLGIDSKVWFKVVTEKINLLKEVDDRLADDLLKNTNQIRADARMSMIFFLVISLTVLLVTLFFATYMIRGLLRQIGGEPGYAQEVVHSIALGDLTVDVKVSEGDTVSLLHSMKMMQERLRNMIGDVKKEAVQVGDMARALAVSADQIAQNVNKESDAVSGMAAAIEELSVSTTHISDQGVSAKNIANNSRSSADKGAQVVNKTVAGLIATAQEIEGASTEVSKLGEDASRISDVVKVIKEIADQTNLLALNAAIEAARAGEQGRGFAVVADEVRKLAERTAGATSEINQMSGKIGDVANLALSDMDKVVRTTRQGVGDAEVAQSSISHIQRSFGEMASVIDDIAAALLEQNAAASELAKNTERVSQMSEENASSAGELLTLAKELEGRANEVRQAVEIFRV